MTRRSTLARSRAHAPALALALALSSSSPLAAAACGSSSHVECDCTDVALRVHVPPERATAVVDVAVSGTACEGASASCVETATAGGCVTYRIAPRAEGYCDIDVDFAQGAPRFSASATIIVGSACCGGFVANPPSAADIVVPSDAIDGGGVG